MVKNNQKICTMKNKVQDIYSIWDHYCQARVPSCKPLPPKYKCPMYNKHAYLQIARNCKVLKYCKNRAHKRKIEHLWVSSVTGKCKQYHDLTRRPCMKFYKISWYPVWAAHKNFAVLVNLRAPCIKWH